MARRVEIRAFYDGYLKRQDRDVAGLASLETKLIPPDLDYRGVGGLRNEAREQLLRYAPRSLGQALRLTGINPADVTLLAVHLARRAGRLARRQQQAAARRVGHRHDRPRRRCRRGKRHRRQRPHSVS